MAKWPHENGNPRKQHPIAISLKMIRLLVVCALCLPLSARAATPVLRLDAGAATSVKIDSGRAASWSDANNKDVLFEQPHADQRPQPGSKLNNRTTLHFDGNDFLRGPAVIHQGDDTFTMIALWRPTRIAIQSIVEQAGTGARGERAAILQVGDRFGFNGQSNDFHNAVPVKVNQWHLTALVVNGADRENVIIINNDAQAVTGTVDIDVQNVGASGITIGRKFVVNGEFFQGDIAEILIFDSVLEQDELKKQLADVKKRWALDFESKVPHIAEAKPIAFNRNPTAEQAAFFESKVRPLLFKHCYECHSGRSEKVKGGLRIDGHPWIAKGGESGTLIVPGNPERGLLMEAIKWQSFEMPPRGKLAKDEIAVLENWVRMGAPFPGTDESAIVVEKEKEPYDWSRFRKEHWAFRPIEKQTGTIDQFVRARLQKAGLKPNEPAAERVLIRRACFDLIGLPPTPGQVEAFLKDSSPNAFEKVINQLLDSPHYGERWGRYWMDVARYSDGMGGFLDNAALPNAWRYRDWLIDALNRDMPYDEFVRLQIAGGLDGNEDDFVATGFFAVGPTYRGDGGDPEATAQAQAETLSDRVDTVSRAFLGLTAACARCHDHKFDPITIKDYYALAGIFRNTQVGTRFFAPKQKVDEYNKAQADIRDQNNAINGFLDDEAKRQKKNRQEIEKLFTDDQKKQLASMRAELKRRQQASPPRPDEAHVLNDSGRSDMHVAIRGNLRRSGELVPRRFLEIVAGKEAAHFKSGSGRLQLADAIVDSSNPLTARVIVNRVWQWHFGKALVRTPSNFGTLGEKPTHPELLDHLAAEFIADGWSLKNLHRKIMLSQTWQMSSRHDESKFAIDGDNRLIWRMNPRKLEVEVWRDTLLAVSGELDRTLGGKPTDNILSSPRRTIYGAISRNGDRYTSDEFLRLFDFPSPRATAATRPVSTVPQQYLFMMNSDFMIRRAEALAKSLGNLTDNAARIRATYERLYGRPVDDRELQLGLAFLGDEQVTGAKWPQYAQVLLSAHELMQIQ